MRCEGRCKVCVYAIAGSIHACLLTECVAVQRFQLACASPLPHLAPASGHTSACPYADYQKTLPSHATPRSLKRQRIVPTGILCR